MQPSKTQAFDYSRDPLAFVYDCFNFPKGQAPTPYQAKILSEFVANKRTAVRGPHGIGKTTIASWIVLWAVLTCDDVKVPTTASAWRQLSKFLWPEIHKWAKRIRWEKLGRAPLQRNELITLSFKPNGGNREAFAVASDKPEFIEGAHARRVVYVFDEAKAIPDATWDAAEGAFSGAGEDTPDEAFALAISTPGEPTGRFYDIHARAPGYEDWHCIHVTLDDAIAAKRVSRQWAEQRKRQWGEKSAVYQNRVRGEFCAGDEDGIIPLAWVELANERWHAWNEAGKPGALTSVGADIADGGDDESTLAPVFDEISLDELRGYREPRGETMQIVGRIVGLLNKTPSARAIVDVIGVGAGVFSRLKEQKFKAVAFNAAEHTDAKDASGELGFVNKRSHGWWHLRELLDPDAARHTSIALPPDDLLTGDLTAPHWKVVSGGKIQVEDKDSIRERIKRSTDRGDAAVMAFYHDPAEQKRTAAAASSRIVKAEQIFG